MKQRDMIGLAGVAAVAVGLVFGFYQWQSDDAGAGAAGGVDLATVRIPVASGVMMSEGKALYAQACASCHGANLEGAPNWREPLADGTYPAPPHDAGGHTWHHPDGYLFAYTKLGGQPFMPQGRKSGMPGFGQDYDDDQILAILGYIKSRWPADALAKQTRITQQAGSQ